MKQIRIFCMITMLFFCTTLKANNILISNITSVTGSGFVQLQFDLSWENSWNNAINRDAAWVFFKFKDLDGTWRHLNLTNANNSITAGFTLQVPTDLTGAFVYRNSGSGTVTLTGVRVGVTNLPGSFDIRGFAIEMVRIPMETTYNLGDGSGNTFYYRGFVANTTFLVNNDAVTLGTTAGLLVDNIASVSGVTLTGFPIGFNSLGSSLNLYMMKHEISQGAYRDFLNTLTYTQQNTRTEVAPNSASGTMALLGAVLSRRNGIQIVTPGVSTSTPAVYGCNLDNDVTFNESTDGEWIGGNYLTYMDVAAFLDWAAMRPMTEMEFEKSARGPLNAVSTENAAGTSASATGTYPISNSGATNEVVTTYSGSVYNANLTYNSTSPNSNSPLRVGIHATAFATRISAGAGYYGCLDLSGNIEEITVTTGNAAGRSFTGVNGDGNLNTNGEADEDFWPGINGNSTVTTANTAYGGTTGVTNAAGYIGRGGSCGTSAATIRTSSRSIPSGTSTRNGAIGGRGVKSF